MMLQSLKQKLCFPERFCNPSYNNGKVKSYESCTDLRAWCLDDHIRSDYLHDVIRNNSFQYYGYINVFEKITKLINFPNQCASLNDEESLCTDDNEDVNKVDNVDDECHGDIRIKNKKFTNNELRNEIHNFDEIARHSSDRQLTDIELCDVGIQVHFPLEEDLKILNDQESNELESCFTKKTILFEENESLNELDLCKTLQNARNSLARNGKEICDSCVPKNATSGSHFIRMRECLINSIENKLEEMVQMYKDLQENLKTHQVELVDTQQELEIVRKQRDSLVKENHAINCLLHSIQQQLNKLVHKRCHSLKSSSRNPQNLENDKFSNSNNVKNASTTIPVIKRCLKQTEGPDILMNTETNSILSCVGCQEIQYNNCPLIERFINENMPFTKEYEVLLDDRRNKEIVIHTVKSVEKFVTNIALQTPEDNLVKSMSNSPCDICGKSQPRKFMVCRIKKTISLRKVSRTSICSKESVHKCDQNSSDDDIALNSDRNSKHLERNILRSTTRLDEVQKTFIVMRKRRNITVGYEISSRLQTIQSSYSDLREPLQSPARTTSQCMHEHQRSD